MAMISPRNACNSRGAVMTAGALRRSAPAAAALPSTKRARVMAWCSQVQAVLLPRCCW
jgi:hypothetical protein